MLFLDSGDVDAVREWHSMGVVEGVTTNPTILRKHGVVEVEKHLGQLAEITAPFPVAIEVMVTDVESTLTAARQTHSIAPNIVIKVPIVTAEGRPCLSIVHRLHLEGIAVNATACFNVGQVYLAARASADYATVFWSRILEEGSDAAEMIRSARRLLDSHGLGTKILAGSLRRADDITRVLLAGAHIATVPPALLERWMDHRYARASAAEFDRDERERLRLADATADATADAATDAAIPAAAATPHRSATRDGEAG